jgi:peroxiredoxin Q/BCP
MTELKVGEPAPDVFFRTHDRKEIHLKDFKGKQNVVVAFYARAFTGG